MSNESKMPIALFVLLWFTSCSQIVKYEKYNSQNKTTYKKHALATTTNFIHTSVPPVRNLKNAKKMASL